MSMGVPVEKQHYYAQIQSQIDVTSRNYCDFFIYARYATFGERICFNSEYWSDIVLNL